jgi:WD40 repeat protein
MLLSESSSTASTNPGLSLLLAVEAQNMANIPGTNDQRDNYIYEARNNLLNVLESNPNLISYLPQDSSYEIGVSFRFDGKVMATSNANGEIRLWNITDPNNPVQIGNTINIGVTITDVLFSPDGNYLFSSDTNGSIRIWNVSNQDAPHQVNSPYSGDIKATYSLALSPSGTLIAAAGDTGTVDIWDVSDPNKQGLPRTSLKSFTSDVMGLAFSPDGKILAVSSLDKAIDLWSISDPATPIKLMSISTGDKDPYAVAFSPEGTTLAVGLGDGTIAFYNVTDPAAASLRSTVSGQNNSINSLAFNPSGTLLASASTDNSIKVWNVEDLQNITEVGFALNGHSGQVNRVTFSPDGTMLASTGGDKETILWSISSPVNSPLNGSVPCDSHGNVVVALNPDGKTLATGEKDSSLTLWDISDPSTPRHLGKPLTNKCARIWSLASISDGNTITSSYGDHSTIIWNIGTPSLIDQACRIANRNLTKEEWRQYFGIRPYKQICTQEKKVAGGTDSQLSTSYNNSSNLPEFSFKSLEAALNASTDQNIDSMAAGQHTQKEFSQVGKTLTFTINLKSNQPLVWTPRWCASDEAKLDENLKQLGFAFYLNDEPIDDSHLFAQKEVYYDMACQTYYAYLFNWPKSTTYLKYVVTIKEPLEDGTYSYPAGEQTFIFKINN